MDAIEFDVHVTADGQPVVLHDPTVERTTLGAGAIAGLNARALAGLDAGARYSPDAGRSFPFRERGLRIPLLRDVLEQFPGTPVLIEIKTAAASAAVRRVVEELGAESRVVVESVDVNAMTPFAGSRIAVGAALPQIRRLLLPALLGRSVSSLPYRTMCLPRSHRGVPLPLRAIASSMRAAGVPVHVWTVNDAAVSLRLWQLGIRGIISDDPGAILRAREAFREG